MGCGCSACRSLLKRSQVLQFDKSCTASFLPAGMFFPQLPLEREMQEEDPIPQASSQYLSNLSSYPCLDL